MIQICNTLEEERLPSLSIITTAHSTDSLCVSCCGIRLDLGAREKSCDSFQLVCFQQHINKFVAGRFPVKEHERMGPRNECKPLSDR